MSAKKLEHYTIWTVELEDSIRFYVNILGLVLGPRPPAPIPGAWLYNDDNSPLVHLVDVASPVSEVLLHDSGRPVGSLRGSGSIDHVAFEAVDLEDVKSKLVSARTIYRQEEIPSMSLIQIFVLDPNGVKVELNFHQNSSLNTTVQSL